MDTLGQTIPKGDKLDTRGKLVDMNLHPTQKLAIARTIMANERTLLSFLRTSLGSFLGGIGLVKFFGHPVFEIAGGIFIILAVTTSISGVRKFRMMKKMIRNVDLEDWQVVKRIIKSKSDE